MLNHFAGIHFEHPLWLILLPFSLLLMASIMFLKLRFQSLNAFHDWQRHAIFRYPLLSFLLLRGHSHREQQRGDVLRLITYGVFVVLVHLALAQPYRLGDRLPDPPEYRDILFLVDTSVSMNLSDYELDGQPVDRMRMVKSVLQHMVDGLPGSMIGLVAFSEQASMLVPLTTDHALVKYQLQRLRPASLTGRKTIVGHALLYTLDALLPYLDDGGTPVIVLMTDANQPAGDVDPDTAAGLLREKGLTLHTIAIGAGDVSAGKSTNRGGLYQPVNFGLLETIAERGGGRFFLANNKESLDQAIDVIREAEKRTITAEPVFLKVPMYQWPLGFAIVWVMMLQLVSQMRRSR